MSTDGVVLSSSPTSVRGSSPIRRRGSTSVSVSDGSDITNRPPRASPTLARTYDPNDPQMRERQQTMDMDMAVAMQLSRARRDTVNISPTIPHREIQREIPTDEATLSSHEQHEIDVARGPEEDIDVDIGQSKRASTSAVDLRDLLPQTHDPSLLVSLSGQPTAMLPDDHSTSAFGTLPSYQAEGSRSNFDFVLMEAFAEAEKQTLGLASPPTSTTKFNIPPHRVRHATDELFAPAATTSSFSGAIPSISAPPPTTATTATSTAIPESDSTSPAPDTPHPSSPAPSTVRQRKLSQSNSHPRLHRKGIGGKLALFESSNNHTNAALGALGTTPPGSLPGRLAFSLGHGADASPGTGPSFEHFGGGGGSGLPPLPHVAASVPPANLSIVPGLSGILNTGHDRPYRFSFYSNALSATIHARSLSELPAEGQSFHDLFSGIDKDTKPNTNWTTSNGGSSARPGPKGYFPGNAKPLAYRNRPAEVFNGMKGLADDPEANTWWLDVLSPTDEEMKMLSKVFSIHPLTTEDIQMEETREKIELFRNYYFVCFRSFDQDSYSPTYLEPLNMYIIVFREGTLSFHFRPTPHPSSVRRRIKQLKDYISVTSDWISYALIDDITDAFGPLIQSIEYEVDSIDELVLILKDSTEQSDMLRRIGTCRKKVMGLLRLMGNKADVVKGLAKRCNENWQVAPTGDIGLYLSDIQDHLITMTQSLNHYEKILSRSHSNYLAQISIEMTEANNQINDVLSKLTALGTVLIPMNLVTGLWGMNVHVPGQDVENYNWFVSIIACLAAFAVIGGYSTYKLMSKK